MKIAYLILAYNQPTHLARLVNALNSNNIYFFIHVDKKSNIEDFRNLIQLENAVFIPERIKVYWGGYSQVEATLNLLQAATNFNVQFDRYCRLSGADFPIKSNLYITEFFANNFDQEFIRVDRKLIGLPKNPSSGNINRYHFLDTSWLNPKATKLKLGRILVKRALLLLPKRRFVKVLPYHGSSWWCLTHQSIKNVLHFVKNNPDYVKFNKSVAVSEEIFFHSIIKASPYAKNISHDFERTDTPLDFERSNEHGCHYIDWSDNESNSPRVLNESDFNRLSESKCIFARKFDQFESQYLLKMLDEKILSR